MFLNNLSLACNFDEAMTNWAKERINIIGQQYKNPCSALSFGYHDGPEVVHKNPVKIFTFHKDEIELIYDWLQYHSFIFGFKNIRLIDNISENPDVCRILSLYKYCGVKITEEPNFTNKRWTLSINMCKEKGDSFLVPIDSDEFLIKPQLHESNLDAIELKEIILETFLRLPIDGRKYKFVTYDIHYSRQQCLIYIETKNDTTVRRVMVDSYLSDYYQPRSNDKTFYYSEGFILTDQGNHFGLVAHDEGKTIFNEIVRNNLSFYYSLNSNLSLYHYSASTYEGFIKKNMRGAKAYGYNSTTDCATAHRGVHYCRLAKICEKRDHMTAVEYLKTCKDIAQYNANSFKSIFFRNSLSQYELLYKTYNFYHERWYEKNYWKMFWSIFF